MRSRPNTGFGILIIGIILFLGCRSMYFTPNDGTPKGTDFAATGQAGSFFSAVQVDPRSEDSAGPVFVRAGDFDADGLMDLASAWNQSQPVQVHLQRRNAAGDLAFETVAIAGTAPIARVAGLNLADMDADGRLDVVVLVKDTGLLPLCDPSCDACDVTNNGGLVQGAIQGALIIFYNPPDAARDLWVPALLRNSFLAGTNDGELPERGSYTDLDVGDIDGDNLPDIVTAFNSAELACPSPYRIDLWANPGGQGDPQQTARNGDAWVRVSIARTAVSSDFGEIPPPTWDFPVRVPDPPPPTVVSACRILDVDQDGDNDVVCAYPAAASVNVRWLVNPLRPNGYLLPVSGDWGPLAPVGHVAPMAERITLGDVDHDGLEDVVVRSSEGKVVQWFKRPASPSYDFIRSPWQVYTLAEFRDRAPQAVAVGDLTGDGQAEVVISAEGALAWFDADRTLTVFDQWNETLIIDDSPPEDNATSNGSSGSITDVLQVLTDPQQQTATESMATLINSLLIEDIDGDGFNDIVGTLDRSDGSGLTNDALILFRNQRRR